MYSAYLKLRRNECIELRIQTSAQRYAIWESEQKILMVVKDNEINKINGSTRFEYGN